jgi:transketolase
VYVRASRAATPPVYREDYDLRFGEAVTLAEGSDVTIIATGCLVVDRALQAAGSLAERGVSCRVVNMHTLKPLDTAAVLAAARETRLIATYEDHNVHGGLGTAVSALVLGHEPVRVLRFGTPDRFCSLTAEYEEMLDMYEFGARHVSDGILRALEEQ